MLVLTRREEETINIGSDVVVVVRRIKGGTVRLGIQAPADITIRRGLKHTPTPKPEPPPAPTPIRPLVWDAAAKCWA